MISIGFRKTFLALFVSFAFVTAVQAADKMRIVALGDSLTAGFGLKIGEAFPDQLQAALRAKGLDVIVENAGVSGDTTSGGLARLDWSISGEQPSLVIVELGANDALRGLSVTNTKQNLSDIISALKSKGIPTLLAGMQAPPNMGPQYVEQFDAVFAQLADELDVYFYPFFLDGVAAQAELNLPDGIHPTAEGVGIIVERILPFVLEALGQ